MKYNFTVNYMYILSHHLNQYIYIYIYKSNPISVQSALGLLLTVSIKKKKFSSQFISTIKNQ